MHNSRDKLKIWLMPTVLIVAFTSFWLLHANEYITFNQLQSHHAQLDLFISRHYIYSVILFMILFAILVSLSIPIGGLFAVAAGYLYSPALALLYTSIASTMGACVLFKIVKSSAGYAVSKAEMRWYQSFKITFSRHKWSYLLIIRLIPLFPFWIVNIATALLNVRFRDFMISTFFGMLPIWLTLILIGHGFSHTIETQQTLNLNVLYTPRILFPLLALALLTSLPIFLRPLIKKIVNKDTPQP